MNKMENKVLAEISLLLNSLSSDIDLSASFVQSGGDSLSAIALVSACRRHGIDLDVGLILSSPSISDLLESGLTYRLPTENTCSNTWPQSDFELQEEMMSPSRTCADSEIATLEDIYPQCKALDTSRPSTSQAYPITEMQLSLLQSSQTDPGTNVITYYETYRPRDIPAMKRAWKAVIDSEPIFRTAFILYEGKGRLVEQDEAPFPWSETMVLTQEAFDASVEGEYVDTGVAMLFRVVTLPDGPRGEGKSTIIWHVHHALIDGYSNGLVIQKLRSVAAGLPYSPGPSFAQLAGHLNTFHQRSRAVGQQFWKNEHEKYPLAAGGILLPAPLPRRQSKRNTTMTVTVNTSFNKTSVYAQRIGITLASLYYAAWALTLSTYVDSDTVVFGAVLSGRDLPLARVKETTGPVINMLPLHISCDRTSTTVDYLRHVFSRLIELASFQWTRPEDGFRRQFSSALAMQFESPTIDTPGISPLARPHSRVVSDVPLHVLIEPDGVIHLNYHSNTYDRIHIEAIGERFRRALLSLLVPHDTITICLEGLLFCQIRQDLYRLGNCKSNLTTAQSIDDDLVALFQGISANFPSAIAVQKGARSLAYAELNRLADCVATSISSLIRPGEVICVHSDRSVNWIVAIYGILKAGGVYCPLDEALPKGLRDSNFKLAGGKLFLTPSVADKVARPSGCMSCISIDEIIACTPKERDIRDPLLLPPLSPAANAYLCFTSGTTGKPKGVMCTHQGLVAFQKDLEIRLLAAPGRRISQLMSPAFDGSIHEIFSALSYGATLVLNDSADPFAHLGSVDSAMLTPSVARMLEPADFPLLSTVYLVGESVPQKISNRWSSCKVLYNMYGPTEATCGATIKRLLPHQTVNIGRPVPSMRVYVLDRRQSFVPPGVIGEIYLAGVQVSRGYVDMPQETAESFMPDSVCPELGESMYRTGDCGYWDNHGELIFLGRNDRQIKLRGFRLDLNDLETRMLRAVPEVTALAVVQKMDFLVAVIQPKSLNISAFRSEIAKVLPLYALPRHVMAVDHLPITSTGKLDYKAIANTSYAQNTLSTSLSRSSPSICQMAAIWREVLGLGSDVLITGDSNLIELGGSSVQQMLLSSRLTATLKRRIPLRLVVASPSLGDLVKATEDLDSLADMTDSAQRSLGDYELSPIERDWWNKYEMGQRCSAFNVSFACKLGASINLSTLTSAWNMVLAHHRILSCKYSVHRRSGVRRVYADHPPIVERVDRLDVWQEVNRPFDLRRSSPIRVTISTDCMVATISHIICDLTTLRVLLLEVAAAYNGSPLKPAQNAYVDTTLLSDTAAPCKFDFWTRYLQRAPDCQYAIGKPRDRTSYGGSSHVSKIVAGTFNDMMNFAVVHKVTFHQLSLAAVALALHHDSAPHDIIIGAPYLNRKFDEDIETIGLFLEPLPIRVRYPPSPAQHDFGQSSDSDFNSHPDSRFEPESFIHSVRRSSQAALTNAVPWHLLLKHLDTAPDFPNHPLFDVMVTFHDDRYETNLSLPHVEPLYTWSQGAKFKLMTEFLAINTATLLLRIEYDTECFDAREIKLLHGFIVAALGLLTAGMGYEEMKERMRSLHEQGIGGAELSEELEGDSGSYFGAELNAL